MTLCGAVTIGQRTLLSWKVKGQILFTDALPITTLRARFVSLLIHLDANVEPH